MYFVLYDRFLRSIGETYILESWSRIQRAIDFDEMRIVGEKIPYSADPFFVTVNDRQGKLMFSGLASTPVINDDTNKTTISLKDYTTLFNTDIIVRWGNFRGDTLEEYLNFLFSAWTQQTDIGFSGIKWNLKDISSVMLDKSVEFPTITKNEFLSDLITDAITYYNLYCKPILDVFNKTLTFVFKRSGIKKENVRLSDFGIESIEKSFGEYNHVTIYGSDYTVNQKWVLTKDNMVRNILSVSKEDMLYPRKNRNFIADEVLSDTLYKAVMGLARNRYQENIDLNAQKYRSILDLTTADFSWLISVYTNEGFYRDLPVGEIETDSKGKHIVRLGYRVQELTQEL